MSRPDDTTLVLDAIGEVEKAIRELPEQLREVLGATERVRGMREVMIERDYFEKHVGHRSKCLFCQCLGPEDGEPDHAPNCPFRPLDANAPVATAGPVTCRAIETGGVHCAAPATYKGIYCEYHVGLAPRPPTLCPCGKMMWECTTHGPFAKPGANVTETVNAMVFLNGAKQSFRCDDCGANVFSRTGDKYRCNGCGATYTGEPVRSE